LLGIYTFVDTQAAAKSAKIRRLNLILPVSAATSRQFNERG
jgi:hypothetical protein